MRGQRRVVMALTVAALLISGEAATPVHGATVDETATARLDGVVSVVDGQDEGRVDAASYRQAIRLQSGAFVPITPMSGVNPGDRVSVTVDVPQEVAAAARGKGTVAGVDGPVRITSAQLSAARRVPAASGSTVSSAVAADAVAGGQPLTPRDLKVVSHAQRTSAVSGPQQLVVALVVPRGVKGRPGTPAQVRAQVAGAAAYWREQSHGAIDLRLERTVGPYASAFSCADDPFKMWTEAARATGFVEGPGRHLVMQFPKEALAAGCSYGLASMGSDIGAGGVVYVSDHAWPVLAHEIGHNFGLAHAKAMRCASQTDMALPARRCGGLDEYGDVYDVMGASALDSAGSLSIPAATRIGLVPQRDVASLTSGTRRVTLRSVSSLGGVRGVRVRDARSGAVYWVEYRTRTGRDARLHAPMAAGVRILREEPSSTDTWPGTIVLDGSPTGRANDVSTVVPAGTTFASYGGGVSVTVERAAGATATVVVSASGSGRALAGVKAGRVYKTAPATSARSASVRRRAAAAAVSRVAVPTRRR